MSPLAWLAFVPVLVAARRAASGRRAAQLGWLAGVAYFGVSMHWIYSTCRFAGVPFPVSLIAWSALSCLLALNWGAFAFLARRLATLPEAAWPWACAASWSALEFLTGRFTPRVGGDLLGYSQWRFLAWLQPSSWFGPQGLGFLIMAVNAALALWWLSRRWARPAPRPLWAAAGLAAAWWMAGAAMLAGARPASGTPPRVAILQPNIDQYRKWDAEEADDIRRTLDGLLARAAAARPDLILWPETALPGWLEDPENAAWVAGWARRSGAPQLVGTITADGGVHRNSAVLLDAQGAFAGSYHKRQLVPFGEFVPLRRWLEPYVGILSQMGDFEAGPPVQAPLPTPAGPLGVTLCYEAVFPRWNRLTAAAGARLLANLTNDGWYKDTWGPVHHFYANRFRAVENRIPLVRAANTGISAIIDPWGRIVSRLELLKAGVLVGEVPGVGAFPRGSLYARWGDWLGWLAAAAVLGLLALNERRR
ncbi:MAG: apolipoprotein N-acyltransferase [Elusimicrobia bacterium]|nr:apolipoprotein N-acyltransferase [Elusimicrobiota bacterium]